MLRRAKESPFSNAALICQEDFMHRYANVYAPTRMAFAALLLALGAAAAPAFAQDAVKHGKSKMPGVEVKVTEEMTGAGMVTSGAVLPPIPPITGIGARMSGL